MTHPTPRARRLRPLLLSMALAACAAVQAHKPHQHGHASLALALDGRTLTVALDAPLDGFLGFERAPRSDAERQAAAALLARLREPASLFRPDAAAACKPAGVTVTAPVLEAGAKPGGGEHADLEMEASFECANPQALRTLDVALFEAYPRLQRIDVQVAGPKGQQKVVLRRPARSVSLAR